MIPYTPNNQKLLRLVWQLCNLLGQRQLDSNIGLNHHFNQNTLYDLCNYRRWSSLHNSYISNIPREYYRFGNNQQFLSLMELHIIHLGNSIPICIINTLHSTWIDNLIRLESNYTNYLLYYTRPHINHRYWCQCRLSKMELHLLDCSRCFGWIVQYQLDMCRIFLVLLDCNLGNNSMKSVVYKHHHPNNIYWDTCHRYRHSLKMSHNFQ